MYESKGFIESLAGVVVVDRSIEVDTADDIWVALGDCRSDRATERVAASDDSARVDSTREVGEEDISEGCVG